MGYAVKIGTHAVDAVTGADHTNGIVAAESTSISANLRKRFNANDLRLRSGNSSQYPHRIRSISEQPASVIKIS